MKLAVTATGPDLDADVDPRFGRARYFLIVETEDMSVRPIENDAVDAAGGAGTRAAMTVIDAGAQAVLTGNCGPNAFRTLEAAGVAVVTGATGAARDAVAKYVEGGYQATKGPNVSGHFGSP